MRIDGWERRLRAAVEKHIALPSDYSVSNCYIIPDDAVEAVTGSRMHPAMYGGGAGPKTEKGAAKRLLKHGFHNVEEAFRAKFAEIHPAQASRGDIGVIERDGVVSGGVFTQIGFFTRTAEKAVFLPFADVKTAFRVE